jgi:hypothetical protein
MRKCIIPFCTLVLLMIAGCTSKEIRDLDFKGDLYVKVTTYNEFIHVNNDRDSIELTLGGIDPVETCLTDSSGSHTFKDLSIGTYSLLVSKKGYSESNYSRLGFMGNGGTDTITSSIEHKSTTKILNYSVTFTDDSIRFAGTISHNYSPDVTSFSPKLYVFLSDSANVSYRNYIVSLDISLGYEYGVTFDQGYPLYYYQYFLVPGTKIYVVIYGHNYNESLIYDNQTKKYYDPNVGEPSEVKSIVIP